MCLEFGAAHIQEYFAQRRIPLWIQTLVFTPCWEPREANKAWYRACLSPSLQEIPAGLSVFHPPLPSAPLLPCCFGSGVFFPLRMWTCVDALNDMVKYNGTCWALCGSRHIHHSIVPCAEQEAPEPEPKIVFIHFFIESKTMRHMRHTVY